MSEHRSVNVRFGELDVMRFCAAFAVLTYHYTSGAMLGGATAHESFQALSHVTQYGYLGVNLFFVISGFVIVASAYRRSAIEFAISRAVRLYPTYWVCVTLTCCAVWLFGKTNEGVSLRQYFANLTMLNDYLRVADIDGVYWTLQAELKFYGCVFLLLAIGWFKHFKIWLGVWMLLTISFLASGQPFFLGWFITPHYSALFIAGIAFYLLRRNGRDNFYIALLIASLAVSSVQAYAQVDGFIAHVNGTDRIVAVAMIWVVYGLFALVASQKIALQEGSSLLMLGGLTYPLYLLHNRIGQMFVSRFDGTVNNWILYAAIAALMMLAAYAINRYVDEGFAPQVKRYLLGKVKGLTRSEERSAASQSG